MSLDYNVKVIQGFLVPFDKLFETKATPYYLCNHEFDRKNDQYCPKCGSEAKEAIDYQFKPLIDIDFDNLKDNDDSLTDELVLCQVNSNCILEGDDNNYIIGIRLFDEDPICPNPYLQYAKPFQLEYILELIKEYPLEIPFDISSFGIYLLMSIF